MTGLQLTWQTLVALGFDVALLCNRLHFPIIARVKPPVSFNVHRLSMFHVSYTQLIDTYHLSNEELCDVGLTATRLKTMGMTDKDLVQALVAKDTRERGGIAWYVRAFRLTRPLARALVHQTGGAHTTDKMWQSILSALPSA